MHSLDLFLYRPELHFGSPAPLIFVCLLARLCFQVTPFFFGPVARMSFFRGAQCGQFSFVRPLGSQPLTVDLSAAGFLHGAHSSELLFHAHEFMLGGLTTMFFLSLLSSFNFDSFLFLLSALARGFFFHLTPAFLLSSQSIARSQPRGFHFSPARFFCCAQMH
jgi:hypothetical protein